MTARAAFAHRPFRLFQAVRVAWVIGNQMQLVALGWHVYDVTGRALDLGLMGLAMFLPVAILTLPAGAVADRVDRRKLLIACMVGNALLSATLCAAAWARPDEVWPIYAVAVGLGVVKAFAAPTAKAFLPALVSAAELPTAVAWSSGLFQLATIVGPALGGGILAIADRPSAVYAAAALCALVAAGTALAIAVPVRTTLARGPGGLLAGIRFVLGQPVLLGAITLDLLAVFLGGATALLPVFARDILHAGPLGLGILRASPAVGAGLMAIWLAHFPIVRRAGPTLLAAVLVFGVATLGFGLSRHLVLSFGCLAILGAADMVSVVIRGVLVQVATPDDMRGRVSAVSSLFIVASNELGEMESGLMAAWIGVVPAVVFGGAASLVVVAAAAVAWPALRRADRLG